MANVNAILENLGSGVDGTAQTASATSLDGVDDSELYQYGTPVATTTITRWMRVASLTEEILIINEGEVDQADIVLTAGSFVGTGFTSFVATVLQGSITAGQWFQVRFTFTSINVDSIEWGTDGTGFGEVDLAGWSTNTLNYPILGEAGVLLIEKSNSDNNGNLQGGLTWLNGLSGLEDSETHNGITQRHLQTFNRYLYNPGDTFSGLTLPAGKMPLTGNFTIKIECYIILPQLDFATFFYLGNNSALGGLLWLRYSSNRIELIQNLTPPANRLAYYTYTLVSKYIELELICNGGTLADVTISVNGVTLTRTTLLNSTTFNIVDTQPSIMIAGGGAENRCIFSRFQVWNDATKTNKVIDINYPDSGLIDATGNDANATITGTLPIVNVPQNITHDAFSNPIGNIIKSGSDLIAFNGGYTDSETLDQTKSEPFVFAGFFKILEAEAILYDSRQGSGEGLVISVNASSEIKINWFGATGQLDTVTSFTVTLSDWIFIAVNHAGGGTNADYTVYTAAPADSALTVRALTAAQDNLGVYTPSKNIRFLGTSANTKVQAKYWYGQFEMTQAQLTSLFTTYKADY